MIETHEFLTATRKLMSDVERSEFVQYLAYNPKLRWGLEGRGKRGGARVIYFYHDRDMPVYWLTAYAKNEREDLEPPEIKTMRKLVPILAGMNSRRRSRS